MSHNWRNILVSQSDSIQSVLKVIEKESLQLALVVDTEKKLLGTVTDGDIRRAMIDEKPLSTAVSEIMTTAPTVVKIDTSSADALNMMKLMGISSIPILKGGKVVGLETLHKLFQKTQYENPVFLMAGGFGARLRPLTDHCPKPLLKVGDKPILETVLLRFIKAGFKNFYISTHYLHQMIKDHFGDGEKWGVSIKYVHENSPLGTGGAIGLLPAGLPELPMIVMNGDVLTNVNLEHLLAFHNDNDAIATMCVREYEYQVPFGVIEGDGLTIKSMTEKPVQHFRVNAGIYVIDREIINSVEVNEVVDMPTLLERYLHKNVMMFPFHEYWLDIGRMGDYHRAQTDITMLEMN